MGLGALAIFRLGGRSGDQPIAAKELRIVIVNDAESYNSGEVRDEFGSASQVATPAAAPRRGRSRPKGHVQ